jgi:predicted DNA-binding protein with PD1-like motif
MQQLQPNPYFLSTFENDSGLWVRTMLDSRVSPPSVEAMNAILWKDGILAYIGTRFEFGLLESVLKRLRELDLTRYWTSLPEAHLHATLGLSENTSNPGGRSLVLYGSPRTALLTTFLEPLLRYYLSNLMKDQKVHDQMLNFVQYGRESDWSRVACLGYSGAEVRILKEDVQYYYLVIREQLEAVWVEFEDSDSDLQLTF